MKVLYHCPWIPPEWLRIHGAIPKRISTETTTLYNQPPIHVGTCPHVSEFSSISQNSKEYDAVIFTSMCDQMRRNHELFNSSQPKFIFNLPSTWQTHTSHKLYTYEIKRLGKWLTSLTKKSYKDYELYQELNQTFQNRQQLCCSIEEYQAFSNEIIPYENLLWETGKISENLIFSSNNKKTIPLLLIGSPIATASQKLFKLIELFNGRVAYDYTEGGWHHIPDTIDQRLLIDNPFEAMINAYENLPGIFHRPNIIWYRKIQEIIKQNEIQGVIFWQQPWCDLWHGEVQRFKTWCPIPILHLTANDHGEIDAHTQGRIEAFMEILQD